MRKRHEKQCPNGDLGSVKEYGWNWGKEMSGEWNEVEVGGEQKQDEGVCLLRGKNNKYVQPSAKDPLGTAFINSTLSFRMWTPSTLQEGLHDFIYGLAQ